MRRCDSNAGALTLPPALQVLLRVFACRSATVHEEALLAVGAFNYAAGKQFVKYMESFFPVLLQGLTNHQVGAASISCSSKLKWKRLKCRCNANDCAVLVAQLPYVHVT